MRSGHANESHRLPRLLKRHSRHQPGAVFEHDAQRFFDVCSRNLRSTRLAVSAPVFSPLFVTR